jgi:hypothetical protein
MPRPTSAPNPPQQAQDALAEHTQVELPSHTLPDVPEAPELPELPDMAAPGFPPLELPDNSEVGIDMAAAHVPDFILDVG